MSQDTELRVAERAARAGDQQAAEAVKVARLRQGLSAFERAFHLTPGWDCRTKCMHNPPRRGDHGQHGDEWDYLIKSADGLVTTGLTVFSGRYVNDAPRPPTAAYITVHSALPPAGTNDCSYVAGGKCGTPWSSGGAADLIYNEHGHHSDMLGPGQSEEFWLALEARHVELDKLVREEVDLAARTHDCEHCGGTGKVVRP